MSAYVFRCNRCTTTASDWHGPTIKTFTEHHMETVHPRADEDDRVAIQRAREQIAAIHKRACTAESQLAAYAMATTDAEIAAGEAQDEAETLRARLAAVEALFAGGPDTECRTSWDDGIECVNVPISSLRAALVGSTE